MNAKIFVFYRTENMMELWSFFWGNVATGSYLPPAPLSFLIHLARGAELSKDMVQI